ncbi:helix-turn-helix domain-containing protein [Halorussus sp. AFM4]|uniref:helix-turn-helix domain-containing protein n=1 Tax=Halorussus sp. AFM4 TaxID=3421651 RepID=UPI003EC1199A
MSRDHDDEAPDSNAEEPNGSDADDPRDSDADDPRDSDADRRRDPNLPHRPYAIFVRAQLSHPDLPLVPALGDAPEMRVRPRSALPGTARLFVVGTGGDHASFEAGLVDDPTVVDPSLVGERADRRVYRVDVADRAREPLSLLASADAYVHDASGTRDGWTVRMELPDREALVGFVRECRAADVDLTIRRITDTEGLDRRHDYGLSADQGRLLRLAYEAGYFDVPRRVSQTDLAESLDLSTSAVSQRLRRATAELVANALLPRDDS